MPRDFPELESSLLLASTHLLDRGDRSDFDPAGRATCLSAVAVDLQECFGIEFSLYDGESGELLVPGSQPLGDPLFQGALARTICQERRPQLLAEEGGVILLGIPLRAWHSECWMALGKFVCERPTSAEALRDSARLLGLSVERTQAWHAAQSLWTPESLLRMSSTWLAKLKAESRAAQAKSELEKVALNLASTYEEITLLYGVTQNLRISSSDGDTGRFALRNLAACVPAQCVALRLNPVAEPGATTYRARTQPELIVEGSCPVTNDELAQLIEHLKLSGQTGPLVANLPVTRSADWPLPSVRQMIAVPVVEGENLFGWLVAFNHVEDREFYTVEASLMASVGVMLGIHSGNRELYRQQAEFLATVVRALSSAIDAKDPYTCGHSDRVARIAVRLAQELQCDDEMLQTIYMAGLLHDIGKIGIQEAVLRKPDRLTPEEYEHIKQHPEFGFKILVDIRQLRDVLPAVLHHHEQWDGKGYPHGLAGERIPRIARIMAVADAYDAMFSSRPYRPGMPEAKVESILRDGAGQQWDAVVVDAYFRARDDIGDIGSHERANLSLDVRQWTK